MQGFSIIVLSWSVGAFIYFKIAFDALFRRDITIIASLLMGLGIGVVVFVASGIYAARLLPYNWSPGRKPATCTELVLKICCLFVGVMTTYLVAARLIIFGFSKRLNGEINFFHFGYRNKIDDDFDK